MSVFLTALGLAISWGVLLARPAAAQRSWDPVVATVPGGALAKPDPPAETQRPPVMVDPRAFPPPAQAPAGKPLPQGAWSPLVTGAIPDRRPPSRPQGTAAKAAADAATKRDAATSDRLSPVRPTRGGAVAEARGPAAAEPGGTEDGDEEHTPPTRPGPLDALPPTATAAQQYCFNTADTAADARFAWQAKKIQEMEAELNKRAELLEAKTEEYKKWVERRDEFSRKAHEKLVGFYSRMRADAAAEQLAAIDEETAAAVVTKLETKVASQIMGEMDPLQAAKIASVIAGAAKTKPAARRAKSRSGAPPRGASGAAGPGNAAAARGRPES